MTLEEGCYEYLYPPTHVNKLLREEEQIHF